MATAICDNGHITHWRAQRGCTLKQLRCSQAGCKAELHAATRTESGWQKRQSKSTGQSGRKKANCVICGRSAFCKPRTSAVITYLHCAVTAAYAYPMPIVIQLDDPICWRHSVWPGKSWFVSDGNIFDWLRAQRND